MFSLADVIPVIQDNKRYTMKDIGKLDKRIKNLEYYTSLSLLEQSAADIHMVDGNGKPRFKNGILVDSFKSQHVADMAHEECSESMDKENGLLRPECPTKNVNLIHKTSGNTATKTSSLWTTPYSEQAHTVQPYASVAINVNPYNVFSWDGRVQLSPESDEWKETDVRPDVVIDDDGPGIAKEEYENVFKPFYKIDKSRGDSKSSVGLGLSITSDIIKSHGGNVLLEKSPANGLRVKIFLPL